MSTTAGVASQEYVAINLFAVLSAIGGVLSALVFVSPLFLVVPAVTLVLGLVSRRQIASSNGTQTGRIGSWVGILLAVGLSAVLIANEVKSYRQMRENQAKVLALCEQLETALVQKKYDAAFAMFADRFKADRRMDVTAFSQRFEHLAPPQMGQLASVKSNGLVQWISGGEPGLNMARTMLVCKWSQSKEEARFDITFVQTPDRGWQVIELPSIFPAPQPAVPGTPPAM